MFAEELRRAIEGAPRITLPQVTALLWRAYGEGQVSEAEAEALSGLIAARREAGAGRPAGQSPNPSGTAASATTDAGVPRNGPRRASVGARPRTDASLERRRRWASSGRLPPGLAARFTLAEQAVLALVAAESVRRKDCRLAVGNLAAVTGVSETTVRNAIREAVRLGLLTVEERRMTGWRNDTNVVRIVSAEWAAWLRLTRKRTEGASVGTDEGGGCKSPNPTPTILPILGIPRTKPPSQRLPEGSGRPQAKRSVQNRRDR